MIHQRDIAILQKLYNATVAKAITWTEGDDGWYTTNVGGREICFRFLYFEATNQVGADRSMIEFHMPGRNARFACGTEGFDILMEVLDAAFGWGIAGRGDPLKFLDDALPDTKNTKGTDPVQE